MRKTKKQLLGLAGLAAVGVMTAVACSLPAPDAAAEAPESGTTGTGDVNLNVTVRNGVNDVKLIQPLDGMVTTDYLVNVEYSYEETEKVNTYIEYRDDNDKIVRKLVNTFVPTETAGRNSFQLNLADYSVKDKDYKLSVESINNQGVPSAADTVSFSYRAVSTTPGESTAPNGDPTIDVEVNSEIDHFQVQVYDKNGDPVFVNKDGKEEPLIYGRDDIDPATGKIHIDLPFEKYGVQPGEYTGVIVGYDKNDNVLSMSTFNISYHPTAPDVPNAGTLMIGDLNISRLDYLLTGLIAFGAVAAFALFIAFRRHRR